jgi:hypothetical protein
VELQLALYFERVRREPQIADDALDVWMLLVHTTAHALNARLLQIYLADSSSAVRTTVERMR